ncbi:hypothetical protein [Hyalangium rubrum]|uniref:Cytochrome c domain-containing protein n=1 Tax=Hyalangium rubrum TaxID=3103134 RepID=A0ABU5HDZ1_9BACT|nr:hypothetical protein [Hyalangium sp. s54d21]MDY7231495.1 hypothetical protein [Hyalangium sp. s54d21]
MGALVVLAACAPPAEEGEELQVTAARQDEVVDLAAIDPARELFITDVSVVDDSFYTKWAPGKSNTDPEGGWSFGRLIDSMMPEQWQSPYGRSQYVLYWLKTWEQDQTVNGQVIPARPRIRSLIVDPWRAASGCTGSDDRCVLDFAKAPFRLLAIVYRPDLRRLPTSTDPGHAGQGRFVFGALGPDGERLAFTVIFEYQLPISHKKDIHTWARRWHELSTHPFGRNYNQKLHSVTREFTKEKAARGRVNGSALLQIRTNEVPLSPVEPKLWELREFVLGSYGVLRPATVKQEVNAALIGSATLGAWASANAPAILAGQHVVPSSYQGQPFLAAAAPVPSTLAWPVPGVTEEVRRAFAVATCSGCHKSETGTNFLHVRTREVGSPALLSEFLTQELSPGGPRKADYQQLLNTAADQVKDGKGKDHKERKHDDDDDDGND